MKKLSKFDLGIIIAFVVAALLGGAAWYYLSDNLNTAVGAAGTAAGDFKNYSSDQVYLPTNANVKTLQNNIDMINAQLDPLIKDKLQSSGSKLSTLSNQDTVGWKRNLVKEATTLNNLAHQHGVTLPTNYYFGFSRYLNSNPPESSTLVLDKQLLAIDQIANILINAQVKGIVGVHRTYEEDTANPGGAANKLDPDRLSGTAVHSPGDVYVAYPFEVDFETTTDGLRKVLDDFVQSPYVFVVRVVDVKNSRLDSPLISDLDKYAPPPPSMTDSPGEAAANKSTAGPQLLFGGETLHVHLRLDLIEWNGLYKGTPPAGGRPNRNGGA